jgi:rhodanese-related sulfurtransferase
MSTLQIPVISPGELANLAIQGKPIALIDVRTPAEFREMHVAFARSVPLDQLDPAALMKDWGDSTVPLYVVCRTGGRAQKACEQFHAAGFTNVVNVEGGTLACERDGLPIARRKESLSLDRQTRIAFGALVLVCAVLSWLVHPAFIAVSALLGTGFIFSGATDICGIRWFVSKMPWNRCRDCAIAEVCCGK